MEGRKEMFYLTMHSTHFIYVYMEGRNGNVLFKNALNTFYLRLYGRKEWNGLFNDALNTRLLEGRKEMVYVLFKNERTQHILVTVIWKEGMKWFI